MLFKRLVVFMGVVLMMIGIAKTASAEFVFGFGSDNDDTVQIAEQVPEDTTVQTPILLEGKSPVLGMLKIKTEAEETAKADEPIEDVEETKLAVEAEQGKDAGEPEAKENETESAEAYESEEMKAAEEARKAESQNQEPKEEKVEPLKEGTIVDPTLDVSKIVLEEYVWEGNVLNSYNGTVKGPNGKETYYNLDMTGVIWIMEELGYNYEYSVREDGVKMYGPFIMVAADLDLRPRGSIIKTSLGWAMVCDTGAFTQWNPTQLDIAVAW